MTALDLSSPVAVVGTGTMGQGIARSRSSRVTPCGLTTRFPGVPTRRPKPIPRRAPRPARREELARRRRTPGRGTRPARAQSRRAGGLRARRRGGAQQLEAKQQLFRELEDIVEQHDRLLATNTSSRSVTAIGGALRNPGRLVGLHFFNPAPLLPLVEVVSGYASDFSSATRAYETARAWARRRSPAPTPPASSSTASPRPFYAEAFAVYEAQAADPDDPRRPARVRRLPDGFQLTDLIGQDVNESSPTYSARQSFFQQDVRFTPSLAQRRLVESGRLGRKQRGAAGTTTGPTPSVRSRTPRRRRRHPRTSSPRVIWVRPPNCSR